MPAALPTFSRGLKLVRLAVFVMLAQLVLAIVISVKAVSASSADDIPNLLEWTKYFFVANIAATVAMLAGVARAIPELARMRIDTRGLVIAVVSFAIATAALAWNYHVLATFMRVVTDPERSYSDMMASAEALKNAPYVTIVKDFAYALGLITVLRTVQRSAAHNDQLALRDEAGHMSRALILMLAVDLFYQLTHGLGVGLGITGFLGSLLVVGYWIYCHVRLQRFLFNAAYFMNEPHDLPVATVIRADDRPARPAPRPSQPAVRAVKAAAPPPVVAPPPPVEPPRAPSASEPPPADGGPRFLR